MGTRADGSDDLLRLRRREHELHVSRRLLHQFQQGVEPLGGDHVRLIDDEYLVAIPRWGEHGPFAQVTRIVHATVARGVDFHHVQAAGATAGQLDAAIARSAWGVRWTFSAVQTTGQDAGRRCLSAATRAGEQVGVGRSIGAESGAERVGDMLLPDHVRERVRTVAAVQSSGHQIRVVGPCDTGRCLGITRSRLARAGPARSAGLPAFFPRGDFAGHRLAWPQHVDARPRIALTLTGPGGMGNGILAPGQPDEYVITCLEESHHLFELAVTKVPRGDLAQELGQDALRLVD